MKTNVLIVEGFASLFNDGIGEKDHKTISHDALPVIFGELNVGAWKEISSTRIFSRKKIRDFLKGRQKHSDNLLILCKSMGVVEIYDYLCHHYDQISEYRKVGILCVDGHSKLLKETFKRRYGKKRWFRRLPGWSNVKIVNFYQQEKYPEGAAWEGADYQEKLSGPGMDHWKIIDSYPVLVGLKELCGWLKR